MCWKWGDTRKVTGYHDLSLSRFFLCLLRMRTISAMDWAILRNEVYMCANFFLQKKNRSYIQNSPRLLPKWVPEIFQVFGSNWSGIRDCRRKERRFYLVIQGWGPCVGDMRGCGGLVLVMWSCGVLCCWWGAMGPCAGDAVCSLVLVIWGCGVLCWWQEEGCRVLCWWWGALVLCRDEGLLWWWEAVVLCCWCGAVESCVGGAGLLSLVLMIQGYVERTRTEITWLLIFLSCSGAGS